MKDKLNVLTIALPTPAVCSTDDATKALLLVGFNQYGPVVRWQGDSHEQDMPLYTLQRMSSWDWYKPREFWESVYDRYNVDENGCTPKTDE